MNSFRLPNLTQRTTVIGRTGSGKTQFGTWLLSHAGFDKQPFVVIDYKRDELLNAINGVEYIGLKELPKRPGLYIMQPTPSDDEAVEAWLTRVWDNENVGLFFDEAYSIPKTSKAFVAILTQGRSKRIPSIVLCQRPSWISRFVFSEASFFALFPLNDKRDLDTVARFMPDGSLDDYGRLTKFQCLWFDVSENWRCILNPVPDADDIVEHFEERLRIIRAGKTKVL